jgi:hypothetical protein
MKSVLISRLIEKEGHRLPPNEARIKRDEHGFPISSPTPPKKRKRDGDSDDETTPFKTRPTAVVNRPMVTIPVDKHRKNQIELSLAQVDPSASFEDRVAQFDHMEAVAKKRKSETMSWEFDKIFVDSFQPPPLQRRTKCRTTWSSFWRRSLRNRCIRGTRIQAMPHASSACAHRHPTRASW